METLEAPVVEKVVAAKKKKVNPEVEFQIFTLQKGKIILTIIGDSPLICHAWDEKVKKEMADKMAGIMPPVRVGPRPARDYEDEFQKSLYEIDPLTGRLISQTIDPTTKQRKEEGSGVYGFPSIGLKAAAVRAAKSVEGISMVDARGAFHIDVEFVTIKGAPTDRNSGDGDMVKVGMGQADIRHRGEFKEWSITFCVTYNKGVLTNEQIVNLFNIAGFAVGIGEWRPERNGQFGRFSVSPEMTIAPPVMVEAVK